MTSSEGGGVLDFFFDFDQDGVFGNNSNEVFQTVLSGGTETVSVAIPEDAAEGTTFARFRISSQGGLSPIGLAYDGEVEDYQVLILVEPGLTCTTLEDFDDVTANALPDGWTTVSTADVLWETTTNGPDTSPNSAFVESVGFISENRLTSPVITIPEWTTQLRFRNHYDTVIGFAGAGTGDLN